MSCKQRRILEPRATFSFRSNQIHSRPNCDCFLVQTHYAGLQVSFIGAPAHQTKNLRLYLYLSLLHAKSIPLLIEDCVTILTKLCIRSYTVSHNGPSRPAPCPTWSLFSIRSMRLMDLLRVLRNTDRTLFHSPEPLLTVLRTWDIKLTLPGPTSYAGRDYCCCSKE